MPAERRLSINLEPVVNNMLDYMQYKLKIAGDKDGAFYKAIIERLIVAEFDKIKDPVDKAVIDIEAFRNPKKRRKNKNGSK